MTRKTLILIPMCLAVAPCTPAQDASVPATAIAPASVTADQMATVDELVRLHEQVFDQSKEILLAVHDKESADAAAVKIKNLWEALGEIGTVMEQNMPPALATMVKERIIDKLDAMRELDIAISHLGLAKPPYYGSRDLVEVLCVPQTPIVENPAPAPEPVKDAASVTKPIPLIPALKDAPAVEAPKAAEDKPAEPKAAPSGLSVEQLQTVKEQMEIYRAVVTDALDVIDSISDKETATAAAPKLKNRLDNMDACCDLLEAWAAEQGIMEAVDALLVDEYKDTVGYLKRLDDALMALAKLDTPFYGSNELEEALTGDEEDGLPASEEDATTLTPEQIVQVGTTVEELLQKAEAIDEVIGTIKDKETATAAAPKLKAMLDDVRKHNDTFAEWAEAEGIGDEVVDLLNGELKPKMDAAWVIGEKLLALGKLGIPYYGSNELEAALEEEDELAEDGTKAAADPEPIHELTEEQQTHIEAVTAKLLAGQDVILSAMRSISDKESADAAAVKIKAALDQIQADLNELKSWVEVQEADLDVVSSLLTTGLESHPEKDTEYNELSAKLEGLEVPFYGSNALEELLRVKGADTPKAPAVEEPAEPVSLTPEQTAKFAEYIGQDDKLTAEAAEILCSVKDKETAEAAAPKFKVVKDAIDTAAQEFEDWVRAQGISEDTMLDTFVSMTKGAELAPTKLDKAILELMTMEVPFYGSNDLETAVRGESAPQAPEKTGEEK